MSSSLLSAWQVRIIREPVRLGEVLVPGMRGAPSPDAPPQHPHPAPPQASAATNFERREWAAAQARVGAVRS